MKVRLGHIETLYWIARLGSFHAAARHLNVSQPAISRRVRELERILGLQLLDRRGYRPRMTTEGGDVMRYAEQILSLVDKFEERLIKSETSSAPIRMGAADTFALTHLSALLAKMREHLPRTPVALEIDFSANLDRRLQSGDLDVAFLTSPTPGPTIVIEPFVDLGLDWVASPKFKLPRRPLTPADLASLPIITNPYPSHLYRTIQEWFTAAGVTPQRLNTCTSLTIMAKLTADGFGISVLPPAILGPEIATRRLVRLKTNPRLSSHHMAIVYRVNSHRPLLSRVVQLAWEVISAPPSLLRDRPARTGRRVP